MKFNISFGNSYHPSIPYTAYFMSLAIGEDMVRFTRMALEELGHEVTVNLNYVDASAINIFFERFQFPEQAAELRQRGCRFGLICTEMLESEGLYNEFEYGVEGAKEMFNGFAAAAREAEFIWHHYESAGPACRSLNQNTHLFPYGFIPNYAELRDPRERRFELDVMVSGARQNIDRRTQRAAELKQRGLTVAYSPFVPQYIRDDVLERVRATLAIQKTDSHNVFSLSRASHAIMNRVPVILEYSGKPTYLSPYCIAAPPAEFLDTCVEFVKRDDIAAYAQATYDRFARDMPMKPITERLLRETFAWA